MFCFVFVGVVCSATFAVVVDLDRDFLLSSPLLRGSSLELRFLYIGYSWLGDRDECESAEKRCSGSDSLIGHSDDDVHSVY